jgi:hypothetical protein
VRPIVIVESMPKAAKEIPYMSAIENEKKIVKEMQTTGIAVE